MPASLYLAEDKGLVPPSYNPSKASKTKDCSSYVVLHHAMKFQPANLQSKVDAANTSQLMKLHGSSIDLYLQANSKELHRYLPSWLTDVSLPGFKHRKVAQRPQFTSQKTGDCALP